MASGAVPLADEHVLLPPDALSLELRDGNKTSIETAFPARAAFSLLGLTSLDAMCVIVQSSGAVKKAEQSAIPGGVGGWFGSHEETVCGLVPCLGECFRKGPGR